MKKREFGELEFAVVKLLGKYEKLTVEEVRIHFGSKDRYTTLLTVMKRLYEKKQLLREKKGRSYVYSLAKKKPYVGLLNRLKKTFFSNDSVEMISYLIEKDQKLDIADLNEIEAMVRRAKKTGKK